MKFVIHMFILVVISLIKLISAGSKLKNKSIRIKHYKKILNRTLTIKKINNSLSDTNNKNITNNDYPHISNHNSKYIEKFNLIKSKNYSRISQDYGDQFENKPSYSGVCMIKYKSHIINIYPLSNLIDNQSLFIKVDSTLFDFDFCKDKFTYSGRRGLFVNRYKDIVYAGNSSVDKYFFIDENKDKEPENSADEENRKNLRESSERNCNFLQIF